MPYNSNTTSATRYNVINGTSAYNNLASPFEAIGLAHKCGGDVIETDSGTVIYESHTNKYYLFQFTNFYGSTSLKSEADDWINGFSYAHAVYGMTGQFYGSNAQVLKGGLYRTEQNSGGYFYNFSNNTWGLSSIKTTVSLSDAELYFSPKGRKNNAYVYVAAIDSSGNEVIETGILMDQYARNSNVWKAYSRNGYGQFSTKNLINANKVDGVYTSPSDVIIEMSLRNNASGVHFNISSSSGTSFSGNVDGWAGSDIRPGENVRFLVAVSFVPDFGYEENVYSLQDLRDNSYFKNVVLESYLYPDIDQEGTPFGFTATSDPPAYSYIYDTDCATHSRNGNNDIVNIFYNRPYTK